MRFYIIKKSFIPNIIKFGTHSYFSLYESLARELIFQIFHCPEMGFFKYKFEFTENNLTHNIISCFESKKEEDKNS